MVHARHHIARRGQTGAKPIEAVGATSGAMGKQQQRISGLRRRKRGIDRSRMALEDRMTRWADVVSHRRDAGINGIPDPRHQRFRLGAAPVPGDLGVIDALCLAHVIGRRAVGERRANPETRKKDACGKASLQHGRFLQPDPNHGWHPASVAGGRYRRMAQAAGSRPSTCSGARSSRQR